MESITPDAVNNARPSQGFIADLIGQQSNTTLTIFATILASAFILPVLNKLLTPRMDPREPPLVKPSIPFIGHIIGIIKHQSGYHKIVHDANPAEPIVTLPMLNGKIYAIYEPSLVQTIIRSKIASFEPFFHEFAKKTFGLSPETFAKITTNPQLVPDFVDAIHKSFATDSLHRMNVHFLSHICAKLSPVSQGSVVVDEGNMGVEKVVAGGLEVENLYMWCRDVMSLATTRALYGDHDPFNEDPSLIDDIGTYEEAVPYFLLSLFPSITMPKAYKARERLQTAMSNYYAAEHDINDPTTAAIVVNRAAEMRKHNFTGKEIGLIECILPSVSTINAVPTFYWMLLFVFDRPDLVDRVRVEVEDAAKVTEHDGRRKVTFTLGEFDAKLPLLISCYREALRLANHSVSNRRVMSDMSVTDPNGKTYLLKAGTDLQLPAGVTHSEESIWGTDASTFDPERFLPASTKEKSPEDERRRKAAYVPFGGGRHLCPGRNFAFAEILGFMAVLLLGFEVEPVGMRFGEMEMNDPMLASATVKPVKMGEGLGARLKRRSGWEDVEWDFVC